MASNRYAYILYNKIAPVHCRQKTINYRVRNRHTYKIKAESVVFDRNDAQFKIQELILWV